MADVVTGEAVVLDVRVARMPSRMLALVLDLLVQGGLLLGVWFLGVRVGAVADPALTAAVSLVTVVLVIVGYPATLESLWRGQTVGKYALGLRVVGDDGGPERFRQALLRALAGVLEIWLTVGSAALITSLVSQQGRRLGDIFAGTLVVRERMPVRGGPVAIMPPQLSGWATGLELSRLSNEVALTTRQFLARYHEMAPQARDEMAWRLAASVHAQIGPPPPAGTPPLAYLSAVLAERRRREEERLGTRQATSAVPYESPSAPYSHAHPHTYDPGREQFSRPGRHQPAGPSHPPEWGRGDGAAPPERANRPREPRDGFAPPS